jgi:hypothetical protein
MEDKRKTCPVPVILAAGNWNYKMNIYVTYIPCKCKAIPLQALTGPEGSSRLRLPDFKTIGTQSWRGCQPYAPAAFTPREMFLVLISIDPRAIVRPEELSMKKSSDNIRNRTRDLPVYSAVPQLLRHRVPHIIRVGGDIQCPYSNENYIFFW